MIHMESVTEFISLPVVTVSYGSTPSSQPPLLLKPRRDVDHGVPASSSPESTPMSRNESSFILAKNEGNTPNIPSQINVNGAPRGTPESTRSPDTSSPISALDLPQRPAPAHIYRYPPARCVSHTSGNRTVEGPFYNEEARARGSNSGTQLLHAIANAALYPVAPPSTSDPGFVSPPPVGNGSLPLPATATTAANRPRNEAIPMVKYVLLLVIAIIIAVGVFVRP